MILEEASWFMIFMVILTVALRVGEALNNSITERERKQWRRVVYFENYVEGSTLRLLSCFSVICNRNGDFSFFGVPNFNFL